MAIIQGTGGETEEVAIITDNVYKGPKKTPCIPNLPQTWALK